MTNEDVLRTVLRAWEEGIAAAQDRTVHGPHYRLNGMSKGSSPRRDELRDGVGFA